MLAAAVLTDGRRRRRPRTCPAGSTSGHPRGHSESAPRGRDIRRTRTEAGKPRLLRAHVGALRHCGPGCRCSSLPAEQNGRAAHRRPGLIVFVAIGVAGTVGCLAGRVGIRPFRSAIRGGGGAGDQRSMLRGVTDLLRRPDGRSRRLSVGVGCRRHRRLGRLLHLAQRDDGPAVRRHRADRADRHRFPVDRRHHPTRPASSPT